MPALDHEIALPATSVMVTIVLLKVAATCATPTTTFFFSFLRARPALFFSAAILLRHFLFAGDRFRGAFARARVGVRALTADRKALAVTQAAIRTEVHKTLDVHRHFAAQIAFHEIIAVDRFADLNDFGFRQVGDAAVRRDADLLDDLTGLCGTDSMDIAEADFDPLLGGPVD